jgi:hypothetical protein
MSSVIFASCQKFSDVSKDSSDSIFKTSNRRTVLLGSYSEDSVGCLTLKLKPLRFSRNVRTCLPVDMTWHRRINKFSLNEKSYVFCGVKLWLTVESSWNVMAHGDAREGKWRGNWRMEWVASTLHTTSEHGVSSITTSDWHTSAASSRLNWRPRRFKWTRPFRWKTKSGFCTCAITFQLASTTKQIPGYCCKLGHDHFWPRKFQLVI